MSAFSCVHVPNSPIGGVPRMPRTAHAMRTVPAVSRTGLTLLEVMVALVILGVVVTGFLEAFAGALRGTADARIWAQALVYGEQGQELIKVEGIDRARGTKAALGGGFARHIAVQPWGEGVVRATVKVTLPNGARFELDRLVAAP
jgi:prepilin-type N-terminal cleavage/methylation domain-containing protein